MVAALDSSGLAGLSNPGVAILDASSYPLAVEANDGFNPWLPSSVDPGRTAAFLLTGGGLLLTFVGVFYGGLRQGEMIAFCVVAYVNSLVLALASIFQKALGSDTMLGIWETMNPSFFATFAYKNHWVGFATLSLFCGVAWFLSRHQSPGTKNDPRVFVGFTLPILLLTLPMSGSRAGVVLLLLMMVLLLGSLRGRSMASRVGTVLFILGLAGLIWKASSSTLVQRWKKTDGEIKAYSNRGDLVFGSNRIFLSGYALRMIRDQPLFGTGPGSHLYLLPVYMDRYPPENRSLKRKNATQPVEYVHSDWLQLVVELGLVGFALLVFPPLFLLVSSRGRGFDKLTRCLLWGCALLGCLSCGNSPSLTRQTHSCSPSCRPWLASVSRH